VIVWANHDLDRVDSRICLRYLIYHDLNEALVGHRAAEGVAGEQRQRQRFDLSVDRAIEGRLVRVAQQLLVRIFTEVWHNGVDDPIGPAPEVARPGRHGGTGTQHPVAGDVALGALVVDGVSQRLAASGQDGTTDATLTQQGSIGSVDNRID